MGVVEISNRLFLLELFYFLREKMIKKYMNFA